MCPLTLLQKQKYEQERVIPSEKEQEQESQYEAVVRQLSKAKREIKTNLEQKKWHCKISPSQKYAYRSIGSTPSVLRCDLPTRQSFAANTRKEKKRLDVQ